MNFVDDDMLKLTLMLIIWMAVSDEQLVNMRNMLVTFEVSNCGMVVSFEQEENMFLMLVTLEVSNCGMVVRFGQ